MSETALPASFYDKSKPKPVKKNIEPVESKFSQISEEINFNGGFSFKQGASHP